MTSSSVHSCGHEDERSADLQGLHETDGICCQSELQLCKKAHMRCCRASAACIFGFFPRSDTAACSPGSMWSTKFRLQSRIHQFMACVLLNTFHEHTAELCSRGNRGLFLLGEHQQIARSKPLGAYFTIVPSSGMSLTLRSPATRQERCQPASRQL